MADWSWTIMASPRNLIYKYTGKRCSPGNNLYELLPGKGVLHASVEVLVAVVVPHPPLRVA